MPSLGPDIIPDSALEDIFSPGGILARHLREYESRPEQLQMAKAVARALSGGTLAVEAGTGIGKTLAYLVPAALSGQKIVISTGTLNLQDQILNKEIPFLKKYIAPELDALCVKGRRNYLCLYRWKQVTAARQMHLFENDGEIERLREWVRETQTGDRAEIPWLRDDSPLWHEISSSSSQCLGMHCPEASSCFISQLRKQAARAQILIVNHHLFFSDLALRRFGHAEVLPRYESIVFDEAHHLENVATQYFGRSFSQYQLKDLTKDIEKLATSQLKGKKRERTLQTARALAGQGNLFAAIFPRERGRFPLLEFIELSPGWDIELERLKDHLTVLADLLEQLSLTGDIWNGMLRRCEELQNNLLVITEEHNSSHVYWYERREKTIALVASPIEIASEMQHFYDQVRSIVFTSATLAASGDFSYFFDRLGLDRDTETLTLRTPFDYAGRTLLYVPENSFPPPGHPAYFREAHKHMFELIKASNGRALLLFTSIKAMQAMHEFLADHLRDEQLSFPLLLQGAAPKSILLETFRKETHSVLLAVASFWEGVDVPGESLSCVIIDKLPFEVPSDPVIMARIAKIEEEGGKPFFDFQVPKAILTLRQGLGRLMRSASDRGVLALMDVRLFTKSYGSRFRKSLPPCPITRSLDDVRTFFSGEHKT